MSGPEPPENPGSEATQGPLPGLEQIPPTLRVVLVLLFAALIGLVVFELLGNVLLYLLRFLAGPGPEL